MPGHFVFVRFFLGYTERFQFERVIHREDKDVSEAIETLCQEWWSDPANRHRFQAAQGEAVRRRIELDLLEGRLRLPVPPPARHDRRTAGSDGNGDPTARMGQPRIGVGLRELQGFHVHAPTMPGEPTNIPSYEGIATVAGWIRWPSLEPLPPHFHKLSSPDALDTRVSRERIVAAAAPWKSLPPLDSFPPYRISPRYPVAQFDSKDVADDAATALQATLAELAQGASAQEDRDDLAVLLREANPQFFVVSESTLLRPELARTKAKVGRVRGPMAGEPPVEERFLRVYWPMIHPTLENFDTTPLSMAVSAPANPQSPKAGAPTTTKTKASTKRGDARAKIIAALTQHHRYANGGCLNTEAIGVNRLARLAAVAASSVTAFFDKEFGREKESGGTKTDGHRQYQILCRKSTPGLVAALKRLNDEFSPRHHVRHDDIQEREDE